MIQDLQGLSLITELTAADFDMFKTAVRTLLAKTFIIRGIEKERELYDFTIRNGSLFDAWFSCMDAYLVRDESLGVVSFRGGGDTRLRLGREETCAFLVARLLYEEKRAELFLTAFPTVSIGDFVDRYNAMADEKLKKTRQKEIFRRLQSYKVIAFDTSDFADPEGTMILYPSLAMGIDRDGIDELMTQISPVTAAKSDGEKNELN
ncbi:hypothetical protein AGMMS49587_08110 [Spirochaetia bacterium]|nr:hypothetical protein AGMMS49587_08110 [Spirochaetia bacterium]